MFLCSLLTAQLPLGGTLPTVGTLGDAPRAETFTIELHDTGALSVAGVPVSFDECVAKLQIAAQKLPGDALAGLQTSRLNVLIRAADAVPAILLDKLMRACADPKVATPRVFFGATHVDDGEEGAFALFLPHDGGGAAAGAEVIPVVVEGGDDGSVEGLEAYLRRFVAAMQPAQREGATVHLIATGDLRWREGMLLLDACARCGMSGTMLEIRATRAQQQAWNRSHDYRALCKASPARADVGCRIGPMVVRAERAGAAPNRVQGAFAGFPRSTRAAIAEEQVVEEVVAHEPEDTGVRAGTGGLAPRGGNAPKATNNAVERGLEWLARHQDDDGKWDADGFMKHDDGTPSDGAGSPVHDVGVTGLALLAFLGAGNTMRSGPYKEQVKNAVQFLRSQQQDNGLIGRNMSHDFIYDHAIAAYAICEAYGLSDSRVLKKYAQRGLNYLESHRNAYSVWRYQPQDQDNDISVTGWAIMAYKSGKYFDLQINDDAMRNAEVFLDSVSDASGLHGYRNANERSSRRKGEHSVRFPPEKTHSLTAVGLFCRFFLGQNPKERPVMGASAKLLTSLPPVWDEQGGTIDHYYWYYATYALFQMGGPAWRRWQKAIDQVVPKHQHQQRGQKNLYGSWDPVGAWGSDGGRVYSTAILTLTMQANYRYTPLVR
ncbi:MAG: terpene cyclase/mutase family protein [Planctomycetes bacterium]|nr:terpene cyclase/mutase family protein [Planctomycetota bacterium]